MALLSAIVLDMLVYSLLILILRAISRNQNFSSESEVLNPNTRKQRLPHSIDRDQQLARLTCVINTLFPSIQAFLQLFALVHHLDPHLHHFLYLKA